MESRFLDIAGAAEYLSRSRLALRMLVKRGRIPVIRDGRRVFFDREALDAWKKEKAHGLQAREVLLPEANGRGEKAPQVSVGDGPSRGPKAGGEVGAGDPRGGEPCPHCGAVVGGIRADVHGPQGSRR